MNFIKISIMTTSLKHLKNRRKKEAKPRKKERKQTEKIKETL